MFPNGEEGRKSTHDKHSHSMIHMIITRERSYKKGTKPKDIEGNMPSIV